MASRSMVWKWLDFIALIPYPWLRIYLFPSSWAFHVLTTDHHLIPPCVCLLDQKLNLLAQFVNCSYHRLPSATSTSTANHPFPLLNLVCMHMHHQQLALKQSKYQIRWSLVANIDWLKDLQPFINNNNAKDHMVTRGHEHSRPAAKLMCHH